LSDEENLQTLVKKKRQKIEMMFLAKPLNSKLRNNKDSELKKELDDVNDEYWNKWKREKVCFIQLIYLK